LKKKIKSLEEIVEIVKKAKSHKSTVSLITGCFDVVHIGHIKLLSFAKKRSDIVIVGLENDQNIKIAKGGDRPIHKLEERIEVLSELISIDYVFAIESVIDFSSPGANRQYLFLYKKIKPDYLVTNLHADRFWKNKQKHANEIGIKLLLDKRRRLSASSKIVELLEKQF